VLGFPPEVPGIIKGDAGRAVRPCVAVRLSCVGVGSRARFRTGAVRAIRCGRPSPAGFDVGLGLSFTRSGEGVKNRARRGSSSGRGIASDPGDDPRGQARDQGEPPSGSHRSIGYRVGGNRSGRHVDRSDGPTPRHTRRDQCADDQQALDPCADAQAQRARVQRAVEVVVRERPSARDAQCGEDHRPCDPQCPGAGLDQEQRHDRSGRGGRERECGRLGSAPEVVDLERRGQIPRNVRDDQVRIERTQPGHRDRDPRQEQPSSVRRNLEHARAVWV